MNAGSIDAILTLNATSFDTGIDSAIGKVDKFKSSIESFTKEGKAFGIVFGDVLKSIEDATPSLTKLNEELSRLKNLDTLSSALKRVADAVKTLGDKSLDLEKGMTAVNTIMESFQSTVKPIEVTVRNIVTDFTKLRGEEEQVVKSTYDVDRAFKQMQQDLMNTAHFVRYKEQMASMNAEFERSRNELLKFAQSGVQASAEVDKIVSANVRVKEQLASMNAEFERSREELLRFAETGVEAFNKVDAVSDRLKPQIASMNAEFERSREELLRVAQSLNQLQKEENETANSTNKATQSIQRQNSAFNQGVGSANRMTSATNRLKSAMSSLRMIGTMVASMMVWNFASSLVNATRETVNAKSEMEGYFQMLHFTQSEIDQFNQKLEETVGKFQRINKYALGETISSIGVEFNLSTQEMEKAMPVVSMITSEYLRAGRNVNEASLAVKDILQGEFQRLSRETGVKGDQLKEAGWSGDKTDVMGLLEALDKIGHDRNWDLFVTKANSLNDAVLILQNRFSEWSADMVNVVQPTILSVFNMLMGLGQGLSQTLSSIWQWLNGGSWGAIATNIGLIGGAILTVSQALVMYRAGIGLVEASQMGFVKSLASVVLGLKGEEIATQGVLTSIKAKILGVKAESIAEKGVTSAISEKLTFMKLETVDTKLNTLASEENTTVKKAQAIQVRINKAVDEGLIATEEAKTLQQQLNTIVTEEQTIANGGLIASLYLLGTEEAIVTGETSALAIAWGVLNGIFALSPIGWITMGILALASAIYVLTGGLSDAWGKMQQFNESMRDTSSEYQKAQKWKDQYIEQHKNEADAVEKANGEYDKYIGNLQSASYWYNESQTAFNGLDLTSNVTGEGVLKKYGISKKDAQEWNDNVESLVLGKNKYYKAEQVLNKQINGENSNFAKDMDEYLAKVQANNGDMEEAYSKMKGNYDNLAMHSYLANTSENWFDWAFNSLYAGMDQFWIDWDMFWANPQWGKQIDDIGKWLFGGKSFSEIGKGLQDEIAGWQKGARDFLQPLNDFGDEVNKFLNDPLGYMGVQGHLDNVWKEMFEPLIKGITVDLPNYINESLAHWGDVFNGIIDFLLPYWENFISFDWLFNGESSGFATIDILSIMDFLNTNLFMPISEALLQFMQDPVSYIGELGMSVAQFLDSILPTDFTSVWQWTFDNIVKPIGDAIWNGIMQIPIVSDIMALLGLISNPTIGAEEKGRAIANWIGTGLTNMIANIPIVGDILRLLGLIPNTYGDANSKGKGVGDNVNKGYFAGTVDMVSKAIQEFTDIANGIMGKIGDAFNSAKAFGESLWEGLNSVMKRSSPGFFHDEIEAEFGTDIPNAISESSSTAYTVAQTYAQQMYDGMNSVNRDFGLGGVVDDYQDDAQIVADYSQLMGLETTTAFNDMTLAVNNTTSQMQGNVVSSYSTMQTKQSQMLTQMKSSNTTAYHEMYTKSNQSLIQMRDSTSNITHQMINAWDVMKNSIIASARQISSDATTHFNQLSSTIGSFYRKIQNPSLWGSAGSPTISRGTVNPRAGRSLAGMFAGGSGVGSYNGASKMSVSSLKLKICPNGDCGSLFDGYNGTEMVDVQEFLESVMGEHGFGGWDFSQSHFSYIKNRTNEWDMKGPTIDLVGGIPTNTNFKVREFADGNTPHISFSKFQDIAGAIFSRIPYRLYFDSSWKGSWLGALQAGACNCFDGASALLALASTFGYSGYMAHGDWSGIGHVWAVINGVPMDTTAWQGGYGWTSPKVHGYGSPHIHKSDDTTGVNLNGDLNITINANGNDVEVDNISEESARQILEILGVSLATGR